MNSIIRRAKIEDAAAFLYLKNQLSFKNAHGSTVRGGFILGSDLETYLKYIAKEYCLVAECEGEIIGFGIVLKNDTLKAEDLWTRRKEAKFEINIEKYEDKQIAYFEQLAFQYGHSRTAIRLCYQLANWAFEMHEYIFTTTVHAPIVNLAAVPYIYKAGGEKIGAINETYPEIGQIISDIYKIDKEHYILRIQEERWRCFFNENES